MGRPLAKHGVSFEEAAEIFALRTTLFIDDGEVVAGENRWKAVGSKNGFRYLLVIHTYPPSEDGEERIRIISARKLGKNEVQKWLW